MDYPINPASHLKGLLKEKGIGQIILAQDTGLSTKSINTICKGKLRISVKTALLFEQYLPPHTAEFWLEMEIKYQLYLARNIEKQNK